jgi:succinate-semialdehyde dehydrogenase/glutarate-semialdehyde dehydrogenase
VSIESIDPATGKSRRSYPELSASGLEEKLSLASRFFPEWRRSTFAERAERLGRAAEILDAEKGRFGELMTAEMGKPIRAAAAEAEKCARVCRFYAEEGEGYLAPTPVETAARRSFVRFDPLGPILAVMPWNFPFWQVFRFAAPALMAGNVALLKHASNVPECALAIEEVFARAGFPPGAFQTLLVGSARVESLIRDPRIAAVTLTGSEAAGQSVGRAAGGEIKRVVLELGGSDPFVVLPSADLASAARAAVKARTVNSGQSCIAAKRFIVHRAVGEEFRERFVAGMAALRVGDPRDPETDVGPLATPAIRAEVAGQVERTVAAGARILLGGSALPGAGNFFAPTVLDDVPEGSPAAAEEIFGPVAALFSAEDLDGAIRIANRSRFGLGASAWTRDPAEQDRLVAEIDAGSVFINAVVQSDPRLPFGGIKKSGFGRELSREGIREFVNVKTVWID